MLWLHRDWIEDRSKAIGDGVRNRALAGKTYPPGLYAGELRRMAELRAKFHAWMAQYDALLTPTLASAAITCRASPVSRRVKASMESLTCF